jgi:hypothetical protein
MNSLAAVPGTEEELQSFRSLAASAAGRDAQQSHKIRAFRNLSLRAGLIFTPAVQWNSQRTGRHPSYSLCGRRPICCHLCSTVCQPALD